MQRAVLTAMMLGGTMASPVMARSVTAWRTVQVIEMQRAPTVDSGSINQEALTNNRAGGSDFRVLDLKRNWRQPRRRAGLEQQTMPINDRDVFQHIGGVATDGSADRNDVPASMIGVPDWMRARLELAGLVRGFAPGCIPSTYRPSGLLGFEDENRRRGHFALMSRIACEYGLPVSLFDALIIRESRYRAAIYSPKLAFGLTQLMPDTARALGVDRYNIEGNLRGGAQYLRSQLDRFGQYHLALAAYNAGPGRVRNGLVPAIQETRAYVDAVLGNWSRLSGRL